MTTEQISEQTEQAAPLVDETKTIDLHEIARKMGVNYETARRWANMKRLPVFKYNGVGRWRAYEKHIDDFIEMHKNKAATWSDK
jgi:predicted site-specific integrase-resolvase